MSAVSKQSFLHCKVVLIILTVSVFLADQERFAFSFVTCGHISRSHQPQAQETSNSLIGRSLSSHSSILAPSSSTALNVWWFGGTEVAERLAAGENSCELVAVRIERTSLNSRRILGEIVVPVPIDDVWAVLTDYNRLAVHVPNLVESKIVGETNKMGGGRGGGEPGDGSYQCRLYQKGAQKIVGFEFGASVTMDMNEFIRREISTVPTMIGYADIYEERRITFKCVDSFFFNEFDGEWKAQALVGNDGQPETLLSYFVDVRPKGPVPVAALEWRIREDVPTNLRAMKFAAMEVGRDGVMAFRQSQKYGSALQLQIEKANKGRGGSLVPTSLYNYWDRDETMAAYLSDH